MWLALGMRSPTRTSCHGVRRPGEEADEGHRGHPGRRPKYAQAPAAGTVGVVGAGVGHQLQTRDAVAATARLPLVDRRLSAGQPKIVQSFQRVSVGEIAEAGVARSRAPRVALMNVNAPGELERG